MTIVDEKYLLEVINRLKQTLAGLKPSGELKTASEEYINLLEKLLTSLRKKRRANE